MAAPSARVDDDATQLQALFERFELRKRSFSRSELAEILNVSESSVDRLLRSRQIPSFQTSNRAIAVTRTDIARYLQSRERVESAPPEPPQEQAPQRRPGRPRQVRKDAGRKRKRP
jgi:transcriptional regulator with XRE-family HTH domain